jgi:hypothetical protein
MDVIIITAQYRLAVRLPAAAWTWLRQLALLFLSALAVIVLLAHDQTPLAWLLAAGNLALMIRAEVGLLDLVRAAWLAAQGGTA